MVSLRVRDEVKDPEQSRRLREFRPPRAGGGSEDES